MLTIANSITVARAMLVGPVVLFLSTDRLGLAVLVGGLFGALDMVDGEVARRMNQETGLGAWLDSVVDRIFYLGMLAGMSLNRSVSVPLLAVLVGCVGTQAVVAAGYTLGRHRFPQRPKTLVGPLLCLLLLLRLSVTSTTAATALEIAIAVAAIDGLWWYAAPLVAPRKRLTHRRVKGLAASCSFRSSRIANNYRMKVDRTAPATSRLVTIPNMITLSRLAPASLGLVSLVNQRFAVAACFGLLFMAMDVLDGFVARELGQVSATGQVLDVVIDKSALLATACVLGIQGWVPLWVVVMVAIRVAIIGVLGGVLTRLGSIPPRNIWSIPATFSVVIVLVSGTRMSVWVASVLNAHNAIYYMYHSGQRILGILGRSNPTSAWDNGESVPSPILDAALGVGATYGVTSLTTAPERLIDPGVEVEHGGIVGANTPNCEVLP